eukprot:jgi/Chrzof1/9626/Cz04g10050.t1
MGKLMVQNRTRVQAVCQFGLVLALAVCVSAQGKDSTARQLANDAGQYKARFLSLYKKLHDPKNGYFSKEGIPYHSIETLMAEAPDQGHETTSEAISYYIWLEALYGKLTGDWKPLQQSWDIMEKWLIPSEAQQSTNGDYNPRSPATYAPEYDKISSYPAKLDSSVPVGVDPIAAEIKAKHGPFVYGMHWLMDVDNWYGFGNGPTLINTFQRGPEESVWKAIPQPSIETFASGGPNGFLDLFGKGAGYSKQWKYTNAPDADARAIQAIYWAKQWADQQGGSPIVNGLIAKAAKMGDWLRYGMFDKYFKKIGAQSTSVGGNGYDSAHYLMAWYYAWGGPLVSQGWAFRIGSSHCHMGYQNPFAAWVLSNQTNFKNGMVSSASKDWAISLQRQIEMYYWLQSAEGGIAGGVTNSFHGQYQAYPPAASAFYGMLYDVAPVYVDPPSNGWFGFQTWSMERVAQYYHESKDPKARSLLLKWGVWAKSNIKWGSTPKATSIPAGLAWQGAPDKSWSGASKGSPVPPANKNLHVKITSYNQDVGIMASLARTFLYFGQADKDATFIGAAKRLLNAVEQYEDPLGYSTPEARPDYLKGFDTKVSVPPGWSGKMPNGDPINSQSTFLSIRSKYKQDPGYKIVADAKAKGTVPVFRYHRFWAQAEIALSFGAAAIMS